MNIEQLIYIVEIANTGSITAAAEKLHVSQPNVTQAILNIERELNTDIFVRSRSGSSATEAGKAIIEKSIEIIKQVNELKEIAQVQSAQLKGKLSIATIPSMCMTLLPKALSVYKNKYPKVQIEVIEGGTFQIEELVKKNEVNLGLVSRRKVSDFSEDLDFIPLMPGEVMALLSKHSPLANKKRISMKDIIKYPIVILNQGYRMHAHILNLLKKFGDPNLLFTARNPESVKKMVMENLAIGFFASISLKTDPYIINGDIIPVKIIEESTTYFGILYKKEKLASHINNEFIKEINIQAANFKRIYNIE